MGPEASHPSSFEVRSGICTGMEICVNQNTTIQYNSTNKQNNSKNMWRHLLSFPPAHQTGEMIVEIPVLISLSPFHVSNFTTCSIPVSYETWQMKHDTWKVNSMIVATMKSRWSKMISRSKRENVIPMARQPYGLSAAALHARKRTP